MNKSNSIAGITRALAAQLALIFFLVQCAFAISVAEGTLTTPGSAGAQSVTGLSFQPEVVIIFGEGKSDSTEGAPFYAGIGFTDCTNFFHRNFEQQDSTANPANAARQGTSDIYHSADPGGSSVLQLAFTSCNADGFTVTYAVTTANESLHWMALGGADIAAKVGTFTTSTGTGTRSVTGVGFQGDVLLVISGQNGNGLGFGAAMSSSSRFAQSFTLPQADPTVAKARQSQAHFVANTSNTTPAHDLDFDSWGADGFTYDREVNAADSTFGYLVLDLTGDLDAEIGTITQPTSTGDQVITTGVEPEIVLLSSWGKAASASQQNDVTFIFGIGTNSSSRRTIVNRSENAVSGSSDAIRKTRVDRVMSIPNQSGTVVAAADLAGPAGATFTLGWTSADATQREINYLVFGNTHVPPPSTGGTDTMMGM